MSNTSPDDAAEASILTGVFDAPGSPLAAIGRAAGVLERAMLALPGRVVGADPALGLARPAGLVWRNLVVRAPAARRVHLEVFRIPGRFFVLHLCGFARLDSAAPVFGFDVVGAAGHVTGMFLDLSPVRPGPPLPRLADFGDLNAFPERRARPDWGDVFSEDFLAIQPRDDSERDRALRLTERAFAGWIDALAIAAPPADATEVAAGQNRYAAAQRRNEHTFRMLAGFIGAAPARRFIDEALFPSADGPATADLAA